MDNERSGQIGLKAFDYFKEMSADISKTIISVRGAISNLKVSLSPIAQILQLFMQDMKQLGDKTYQFSMVMVKSGWPPLSSFDLYPSEIISITEQYDKDATSIQHIVDNFIMNKISDKDLLDKLDSWKKSSWLKKRIPILQEVIEAHIQKKYFIAISGLLPQIEGIIAEGYGHRGQLRGKSYKEYAASLLNDRDKWSFDLIAEEFLLNVILISFEHGNKVGSSLSRHAILHGADVEYGTKANSLKCILLFDYLQNQFRFISTECSNKYHSLGCRVILNTRKRRKVYKNREDAKKEGKEPCKICRP